MPRLDRGIQYAAADAMRASSITRASGYWSPVKPGDDTFGEAGFRLTLHQRPNEKPRRHLRGFRRLRRHATPSASRPCPHPHHEAVEAQLGDLHPGKRFTAESRQARIHLAEMRVGLGEIGVDLVGRAIAALQHLLRERL